MDLLPSSVAAGWPRCHRVALGGRRWPQAPFLPARPATTQHRPYAGRRVAWSGSDRASLLPVPHWGHLATRHASRTSTAREGPLSTLGTGRHTRSTCAAVCQGGRLQGAGYRAPPRVTPPSIVSVWPVIHDASRLSRKLTAPATSS